MLLSSLVKVLINGLTAHWGTGTTFSDWPTYQELAQSGSGCAASAIESELLRIRLLTVPGEVDFQSVGNSSLTSLHPRSDVKHSRFNSQAALLISGFTRWENAASPFQVSLTLLP